MALSVLLTYQPGTLRPSRYQSADPFPQSRLRWFHQPQGKSRQECWYAAAPMNHRAKSAPADAHHFRFSASHRTVTIKAHGNRFEPGFFPRAFFDIVDFVTALFRPACIHTLQHLGPVLRFGTAGTGINLDKVSLPSASPQAFDLLLRRWLLFRSGWPQLRQ